MKKKQEIVVAIIIFILMCLIILPKNIDNLDELWNYNFAKNMAEDRVPYRDFNMITMPLLPIIEAFFLKLIANELMVMRFFGVILSTVIFYLIYIILNKRLNINWCVCSLSTLFLIYIFQEHLIMEYNLAVLLIILILIYRELENIKNDGKVNARYDVITGIIAGTAILFKHTTGIVLSAMNVGYILLLINSKNEISICLKRVLYRIIGICIPVLVLIIYITAIGVWSDFIDYTILGIRTFNNIIPYTSLLNSDKWITRILAALIPVSLLLQITLGYVKNKQEEGKIYLTLFSYSLASIIIIFPISDEPHLLVGGLPSIIALIWIVYMFLNKYLNKKTKKIIKYITLSVFIILLTFYMIQLVKENNKKENYSTLNHYKFIPINEFTESLIMNIDDYIIKSDKEVYILDPIAVALEIPIDKYHKNYDMFLKGNIGGKGETGIIEDLKSKDNIKVLIIKENIERNWQNPEEVRKYIQRNWKRTGEISIFEVYEKI